MTGVQASHHLCPQWLQLSRSRLRGAIQRGRHSRCGDASHYRRNNPNDGGVVVGLGGLPNEIVWSNWNTCCMHGPTRMAGSVAGVRDIICCPLCEVGDGARRARDAGGRGCAAVGFKMGFPPDRLLTERSEGDVPRVAGDDVERRLVGTGAGPLAVSSSPIPPAICQRTMTSKSGAHGKGAATAH